MHSRWLYPPLLLVAVLVTATGCVSFDDYHYEWVKKRETSLAWRAADLRSSPDFERGWKRGYFEVSTGSNGRPPVLPEERYWSTAYQNAIGQRAIAEWYAGYEAGAMAADQSGRREWHFLPASAPPPPVIAGTPVEEIEATAVPRDLTSDADSPPSPRTPDRPGL